MSGSSDGHGADPAAPGANEPPARPPAGSAWQRGVVLIAAVGLTLLALRLGWWQLDRARQKEALQSALDTRATLPPLDAAQLSDDPLAAEAQHHRRVRARGEWLAEATVFLDNRQMRARPGFFVLTPLRLEPPPGAPPGTAERLLWVQRGWVARDNNERTRLPELPTPTGTVEVTGRVAPPPARLYQFAPEGQGRIRQNLDLAESARSLGRPVLPTTLVQTEEPASGPDGLLRDWPRPVVDVQKHHGYAFQWFALGALVAGLYVWFQLIRPRRRRVDVD